MPEHKALVTNWNAMLRAIGEDSAATTGDTAADRIEVAKQRVLVQMLARAAQAEVVAVADPSFLSIDLDPDEADVEAEENAITTTKFKKRKGKKSTSAGMPHEVLSVALLNSLPDLLIKFKVDTTILGSLTTLPRYICKYDMYISFFRCIRAFLIACLYSCFDSAFSVQPYSA